MNVSESFKRYIEQRADIDKHLSNITSIIGVYSAKGGVGKTSVSINLAYAFKALKKKTALLDADVDCPNICNFINIDYNIKPVAPLKPYLHDGISIMSPVFFYGSSEEPAVWRGAILSKALTDILRYTEWPLTDYLIIDLPPGTSDIPLTIMQLIRLDGLVIVTTPDKISYINSLKSGLMAQKLKIRILGVIENMSDSNKESYSDKLAERLSVGVLGRVPYKDSFKNAVELGKAAYELDENIKEIFDNIANNIISILETRKI
ncbi:MAG: ATP-binding protein [Candidatus Micrarchaeota archaeon]|nr:MAG: ATP-binding protein [Candidatus Micrarchaeota archaeon]